MNPQPLTACKQYCLAAGATQGNIAYTQTVVRQHRFAVVKSIVLLRSPLCLLPSCRTTRRLTSFRFSLPVGFPAKRGLGPLVQLPTTCQLTKFGSPLRAFVSESKLSSTALSVGTSSIASLCATLLETLFSFGKKTNK